jgi:hypothetical protein
VHNIVAGYSSLGMPQPGKMPLHVLTCQSQVLTNGAAADAGLVFLENQYQKMGLESKPAQHHFEKRSSSGFQILCVYPLIFFLNDFPQSRVFHLKLTNDRQKLDFWVIFSDVLEEPLKNQSTRLISGRELAFPTDTHIQVHGVWYQKTSERLYIFPKG